MLSEHKSVLRVAEAVAVVSAAGSILIAIRMYRTPDPDFPIELAFILGFALLMLSFLPACMLGGEYVRTVRLPETYRDRSAGLNNQEIGAVIRWAPFWQKAAGFLAILVAVTTAIVFGSVSWSTGKPPSLTDGIAAALYLLAFFLLSLPILGSAARMPGSYAESCRSEA